MVQALVTVLAWATVPVTQTQGTVLMATPTQTMPMVTEPRRPWDTWGIASVVIPTMAMVLMATVIPTMATVLMATVIPMTRATAPTDTPMRTIAPTVTGPKRPWGT